MPDPIILEMKPKFANFSAHNMHSLNLSAILYGTRVFGLDTSGQMYKTTFILPSTTYETNFAFIVMKMQSDIKGLHIVSSEFCPFLEGGWQLEASFSQSFLLPF